MIWTVGVAGSTKYTAQVAAALMADSRFSVKWVLTPNARAVGRHQKVVSNPLQIWAEEQSVEVLNIDQKIDEKLHDELNQKDVVDFLLVLDFGYLVPNWLLQLPKIKPVNIHPSRLPDWRGSSPGQFTLLSGAEITAVDIIEMTPTLDDGPIIAALPFPVSSSWTQTDYYDHAFQLASEQLAETLAKFADGAITSASQPALSPTPLARRLSREDGFIPWAFLLKNLENVSEKDISELAPLTPVENAPLSPLLSELQPLFKVPWPELIERARQALSPWPGLWTMIQTPKGQLRVKLLPNNAAQLEGKTPQTWEELKNQLLGFRTIVSG